MGPNFFKLKASEQKLREANNAVNLRHQNHRGSTTMSYSDVSECENHHSGCWHLPRTQRVGNMEDIEDDIDDVMPFEREVSLDEI